MSPKLVAAKCMSPVYTAACRTGHMPVLQQLLQVAASAPQQHLPVLVKAAAAAGNLSVWQQQVMEPSATAPLEAATLHLGLWVLLAPAAATAAGRCRLLLLTALAAAAAAGCCHSSPKWLTVQPAEACTQQQPPQPAHQQHPTVQQEATQQDQSSTPAASHLPDLCWDLIVISPSSWAAVLHCVLEGLQKHDGAEVLDLAVWIGKDLDRVAMADQLWELLGARALQAAVRSSVQTQLSADVFPWASFRPVQ